MDQRSIDDLVTLTADPKQGLVRKGGYFTLTLPLTPRDVAGMTALWDAWRKASDETAAKSDKKDDPMLAMQRLPAQAMTVATSDKGLVLSIDAVKLYNSFAETFQKFADSRDTPPGPAKEPTSEVRYAREHNWLTGETFTTPQLLTDFAAGTLKTYPSASPVKPGDGLKVIPK
jgi:hypothetical protein